MKVADTGTQLNLRSIMDSSVKHWNDKKGSTDLNIPLNRYLDTLKFLGLSSEIRFSVKISKLLFKL
ncbi:Uncharacterised protein [Wolbachia endosymbiont wPip_Mol of Culex molestus]|nr:hypothetical protein CAI20_03575 [Wolbachia endosymbiont of Chrysomya megacephala]CAQ55327.1 Hypothetical protein WP1219 [Wolbachia endosymbiont of Culex quinquefasciatus Pel]CQD06214.1 Uncharacterised protein [Wolbachia endosymbiont wPip_Mol of Culex molestus]